MIGPLLAVDLEIINLKRQVKLLSIEIRWKYKYIKQAPNEIKTEYDNLCKQLINMTKSLKDKIKITYRKDYHFCVYNEMLKMQLKRHLNKETIVEDEVEPLVEHTLKEQTQL